MNWLDEQKANFEVLGNFSERIIEGLTTTIYLTLLGGALTRALAAEPETRVAGVIAVTDPDTGIDIYMGQGGAPEGVLAAAALQGVPKG